MSLHDSPLLGSQLLAAEIKRQTESIVHRTVPRPTDKLSGVKVYQDSFQGGAADAGGGGVPTGPAEGQIKQQTLTLPDNATYNWDIPDALTTACKGVVIYFDGARGSGDSEAGMIQVSHSGGSAGCGGGANVFLGAGLGIDWLSLTASIVSGQLRLAIPVDNSSGTDVSLRLSWFLHLP